MEYGKEIFLEAYNEYQEIINGLGNDFEALYDDLEGLNYEAFDDEFKSFDFSIGPLESTIRLVEGKIILPKEFIFYTNDRPWAYTTGTKEEILNQLEKEGAKMKNVLIEVEDSVVRDVFASENIDVYIRDYDADDFEDGKTWEKYEGGYTNSEVKEKIHDRKEALERKALFKNLKEHYQAEELAVMTITELKSCYKAQYLKSFKL
jgi:hypothetical protein